MTNVDSPDSNTDDRDDLTYHSVVTVMITLLTTTKLDKCIGTRRQGKKRTLAAYRVSVRYRRDRQTDRQTDKPYGHYASRRRSGKNSRCYN